MATIDGVIVGRREELEAIEALLDGGRVLAVLVQGDLFGRQKDV